MEDLQRWIPVAATVVTMSYLNTYCVEWPKMCLNCSNLIENGRDEEGKERKGRTIKKTPWGKMESQYKAFFVLFY